MQKFFSPNLFVPLAYFPLHFGSAVPTAAQLAAHQPGVPCGGVWNVQATPVPLTVAQSAASRCLRAWVPDPRRSTAGTAAAASRARAAS